MRILFFSDTQYYKNPFRSITKSSGLSSWFLKQLEITDFIFDILEKEKIDLVVHCGDVFEEKNHVDQIVYNNVWEKYRSCKKEMIINSGNHDIINLNRDSTLYPFSDCTKVVSSPISFDYGSLYLRIIPFGQVSDKLLYSPNVNYSKILVTHEFIEGLTWRNKSSYKPNVIKKELLCEWDFVFNGHVHTPQDVGNIVNVGSIMPQDFNEAGEIKRCIVYDSFSNLTKSIQLPGPKFITLDSIPDKINEDNYYRIRISSSELKHSIFSEHNVIPQISKSERREIRLSAGSNFGEDIRDYIELKNKDLDPKKLFEVGKTLYEGGA